MGTEKSPDESLNSHNQMRTVPQIWSEIVSCVKRLTIDYVTQGCLKAQKK